MSWLSKALGSVMSIFGIGGQDDLGKKYEEEMRRQAEAQKLQQANEQKEVTQFEDTGGTTFTGADGPRKKRPTGGYSSLGINAY